MIDIFKKSDEKTYNFIISHFYRTGNFESRQKLQNKNTITEIKNSTDLTADKM